MYLVTSEDYLFEDGISRMTYGLISSSGMTIPNISLHQGEIELFAKKLNLYDASEIHLRDLVDDFLIESV